MFNIVKLGWLTVLMRRVRNRVKTVKRGPAETKHTDNK